MSMGCLGDKKVFLPSHRICLNCRCFSKCEELVKEQNKVYSEGVSYEEEG